MMAATVNRAYYCAKCKRPLANTGAKDATNDTVSTKLLDTSKPKPRVRFIHDECGGQVAPGLSQVR